MRGPRQGLAVALAAGLFAAGCGSGAKSASGHARARTSNGARGARAQNAAPGAGGQTIPTPGPTGVPADPAAVRVIRAWSTALRDGDVGAAASYFALPSEMINGVGADGQALVITIRTERAAQVANATLPCGAVFISADRRGRYVNALFRLTDRPGPGGGCGSGIGQTARTNFVIVGGRIVDWIRAPDDPGDNQGGPAAPAQPPPSSTQSASPLV